jgi:hypothetical protein
MKKFILIIVTIAFFIYPSVCLSSYLIELKNGSTFITNHYWKQKGQIKFYYRGGVVGISKDLVREIRESDLPYKEEVVEQKASRTTEMPNKELYPKTDMTNEDIDVEFYKNRKKEIVEKYREAKKKLDQAIIDRDKIAKRKAKKEIKRLYEQISALSDELKEKNKGVLPKWW